MIVVSNTSPITNLDAIGQLSLLNSLFDTIIIPNAVFQELIDLDMPVPGTQAVQTFPWIQHRQVTNQDMLISLKESLDPGEAEAISLALELQADLLLLDERRAYHIASQLDLSVLGVLGVLLLAKSRGLIEVVKPLLDDLVVEAGFWVSREVYNQTIVLANERPESE